LEGLEELEDSPPVSPDDLLESFISILSALFIGTAGEDCDYI